MLNFVIFVLCCTISYGKTTFTTCGFNSERNYAPWGYFFETDLPTLYPTSESQLASIVTTARSRGCRVRPVGATHSISGVVVQKGESNVVTVNLVDLSVPPSWSFQLDTKLSTVRVPAGASILDLYAFIRPKGYLLPSNTGGWLFSVGGVFLTPAVHGAAVNEDRLTSLLLGVRAVLANGEIVEEIGEEAMQIWRGSSGLLGIVTAVVLRVRKDTGLQLASESFKLSPWSKQVVTDAFNQSMTGFDMFHYWWNSYTDEVTSIKANYDGDPSFNFSQTTKKYAQLQRKYKNIARKASDSALQIGVDIIDYKLNGRTLTNAGFTFLKLGLRGANNSPRDGFYTDPATVFFSDQMEAFIRCRSDCVSDGTLFGILNVTRTYLRRIAPFSTQFPSVALAFRFFNVRNTFLFNYVEPGRYILFEVSAARGGRLDRDQDAAPYFAELERIWNEFSWSWTKSRARFHLSKLWGWGIIPGLPRPYPGQSEEAAKSVYNTAKRTAILNVMRKYDPDGVFVAGVIPRFLGISNVKYEPRRGSVGTSQVSTGCFTFRNPECISKCCCNSFWCGTNRWKCVKSGVERFGRCRISCMCKSNRCRLGRCI